MSLSIGYTGGPSMDPNFSHNPLNSIVPNNISLYTSEIRNAVRSLQTPPWGILNQRQKKLVTAFVLEARGDPTSLAQAQQVLIGNPAFADVAVLIG